MVDGDSVGRRRRRDSVCLGTASRANALVRMPACRALLPSRGALLACSAPAPRFHSRSSCSCAPFAPAPAPAPARAPLPLPLPLSLPSRLPRALAPGEVRLRRVRGWTAVSRVAATDHADWPRGRVAAATDHADCGAGRARGSHRDLSKTAGRAGDAVRSASAMVSVMWASVRVRLSFRFLCSNPSSLPSPSIIVLLWWTARGHI